MNEGVASRSDDGVVEKENETWSSDSGYCGQLGITKKPKKHPGLRPPLFEKRGMLR